MTTNTEQKYRFFGAADKAPTQFKRVVELCGRNNGSLSILLQFIPVFLFVFLEPFTLILKKRHRSHAGRFLYLYIYIFLVLCTHLGLNVFHLFAAAEPQWRKISKWRLSKSLGLSVAAFCAAHI